MSPIFWPLRKCATCGDRLMLSWPPATTMSASPAAICCAPRATARKPEPHTWFTPQAVASIGMPAAIGRLAGRVLALARRQHLTQDDFVDIGRIDLGALQRGLDGDLAKGMRRQARQRAVKGANRRPGRADDDNLFRFHTSLQLPQGTKVIT